MQSSTVKHINFEKRTEMKKNPEATAKTFRAMVASSAF
jgi:hypothetical protein